MKAMRWRVCMAMPVPWVPFSSSCSWAFPKWRPQFAVLSRYLSTKIPWVSCIGDLMEELRRSLPVLFRDCLVQFFVELISLKFRFAGLRRGYRKLTPSRRRFTIINVISEIKEAISKWNHSCLLVLQICWSKLGFFSRIIWAILASRSSAARMLPLMAWYLYFITY